MPVEFGKESHYAKESRKWEATHTQFGAPERPYVFQEYPKRMYRFAYAVGQGIHQADAQTANDDLQERNLLSRGFHFGPEAAYRAIEQEQTEHGRLAAEREWEIQHGRVSEKAATEVRQAEQEHGARHLPMVPETPIKKRGRPAKAPAAA